MRSRSHSSDARLWMADPCLGSSSSARRNAASAATSVALLHQDHAQVGMPGGRGGILRQHLLVRLPRLLQAIALGQHVAEVGAGVDVARVARQHLLQHLQRLGLPPHAIPAERHEMKRVQVIRLHRQHAPINLVRRLEVSLLLDGERQLEGLGDRQILARGRQSPRGVVPSPTPLPAPGLASPPASLDWTVVIASSPLTRFARASRDAPFTRTRTRSRPTARSPPRRPPAGPPWCGSRSPG